MLDRITELRRVPVSELIPNPKNWRRHPPAQRKALQGLLDSVGWADAVLARETDDGLMLIDGHLRRDMAGDFEVPVLVLDVSEDEADLILATHDPIAAMAESDVDKLSELVNRIDVDDSRTGDLLAELLPKAVENELPTKGSLVEEFLVPPFSILDTRQGYWQNRKRGWQAIGIKSEIGRGEEGEFLNPNDALLFKSLSGRVPTYYTQKTKAEKKTAKVVEKKKQEVIKQVEQEVLKKVVEVRKEKKIEAKKVATERANYIYKVHDRVRLIDGNAVGTIDKIEKKNVFINYGVFTTKAKIEQLELVEKAKR